MDSDNRKTKAQLVTELEAARQRLRDLEKYSFVEKSNDGIAIIQDGLVKFSNRKAAEIYGFPAKESLEIPFIDFIAPQNRAQVMEMYVKRLRGEEVPATYETGFLTKNGSIVPVEINASLIDYHGKPATLAIVRDITEHKKAEQSLKESEEKFRTIFNNSSDGIGVYRLNEADEPGEFIEVNSTLCEWLGYKYEELMGLTAKNVVKIERGSLSFKEAVAKSRAEGKINIERSLLTRDGREIPVEVSAHITKFQGKEILITVLRNITPRKAAERLQHESEQKFEILAEKSPNMVFINKAGKIVYANPQCEEIMGYRLEELCDPGFNYLRLVAPEFIEKTKANFITHATGKDIPPEEYVFVTKNGKRIDCILSTKLIDYGGSKAILGVVTDITAQKQTETMLQESEEKFRSLAEQSPNAVFINKSGTYVYVNRCFEELLGYSKEELYAPDFDFTTLVAPESREWVKTTYNKHNVDNEDISPFDLSLVTKDGRRIEAILATKLINYADGRAVVGVITDITERKEAEHILKLQADMLDAESDAVYLSDLGGRIAYVNKAACLSHGYTKEELINMEISQLDDPEDARQIGTRIQETLKNGQAVFEVNHLHKNGTSIPVEVHTSLITVDGKTMILGAAHDISERRKVQQQLMAQDRLASIGQLVSGIAHELNNPLTSVIGFSELLLQKQLPDDVVADIKIVNDEAKRTSTIVKNLLTFARQRPQEKCAVNINDPLQSVLQLRSHEQSVNNIAVFTNFAENLPFIMGNDSQLQQVFFNIVTNAEFAMIEANNKGTLTISTRHTGDFIQTTITDDGPGISSDNQQRLFSPFFTTKGPGKGTGLGLSICQGIVSEHGGRIWAESEPGKGATFFIELPV